MSIGRILKEIRESRGYLLKHVANNIKVDFTQLSRIENEKRYPTKEQVEKLASLYNYDRNFLVQYLISDKIVNEIMEEDLGIEVLQIVEKTMKSRVIKSINCESGDKFKLESRRYIGNKAKLVNWILEIIESETKSTDCFIDIFAGSASVARKAMKNYKNVVLNDSLYSNYIIYKAFFEPKSWSEDKVCTLLSKYNKINSEDLVENYFSKNFGGKYFDYTTAKKIGFIRQDIENRKEKLSEKEYNILLAT